MAAMATSTSAAATSPRFVSEGLNEGSGSRSTVGRLAGNAPVIAESGSLERADMGDVSSVSRPMGTGGAIVAIGRRGALATLTHAS